MGSREIPKGTPNFIVNGSALSDIDLHAYADRELASEVRGNELLCAFVSARLCYWHAVSGSGATAGIG